MFQISLRAARVNANMKQEDIAEAMKVSKATIVSWESGKTYPRAEQFKEMCDIYNAPIEHIFLGK